MFVGLIFVVVWVHENSSSLKYSQFSIISAGYIEMSVSLPPPVSPLCQLPHPPLCQLPHLRSMNIFREVEIQVMVKTNVNVEVYGELNMRP